MRHVIALTDEPAEKGLVHYEGVGLIGAQTLCGHTDRTDYRGWKLTNKRVSCPGCIAVRDHVKGAA